MGEPTNAELRSEVLAIQAPATQPRTGLPVRSSNERLTTRTVRAYAFVLRARAPYRGAAARAIFGATANPVWRSQVRGATHSANELSFALERPTIPHLFGARSPFAVLWTVWAVVVDALKRVVGRWPRADVGIEGGERLNPRRTNRNASSAVVLEGFRSRVQAAVLHRSPRLVLWRSRHAVYPVRHL